MGMNNSKCTITQTAVIRICRVTFLLLRYERGEHITVARWRQFEFRTRLGVRTGNYKVKFIYRYILPSQ